MVCSDFKSVYNNVHSSEPMFTSLCSIICLTPSTVSVGCTPKVMVDCPFTKICYVIGHSKTSVTQQQAPAAAASEEGESDWVGKNGTQQ